MKADRFTRAAAVLLAGLLLAAGLPTAGGAILQGSVKVTYELSAEQLAQELAKQVKGVKKRFDANRRALRGERGPGGKAYPGKEVTDLVARTEQDLDQAIARVGEPRLDALRAWAAEEFRRIRGELAQSAGQAAASLRGLSTPRVVAVVATLGSVPRLASSKTDAPQEVAITSEKADSLLDQVGDVVRRIWTLADRNDLEVDLWVGSTPKQKALFKFWPQGKVTGAAPVTKIITTNNEQGRVLRGLYAYTATLGGALIRYSVPAGTPAAQPESERLDLVKESSFFCCRFKDKHNNNDPYCEHVKDKKQCR